MSFHKTALTKVPETITECEVVTQVLFITTREGLLGQVAPPLGSRGQGRGIGFCQAVTE